MNTMATEETTAIAGTPTWNAIDVPPVRNARDEQTTTDYMNLAKSFQTKVKEFFKPHKDRAYAAWKGLCNSENEALANAIETESACKRELGAYRQRLEEAQAIEQRRLQELSRKEEEERRVNEAALLEAQASAEPDLTEAYHLRQEAEALIEAPLVPAPVVMVEPEKAKGAGYGEKWNTTGGDKARFLRHLVAHPELIERSEVIAVLDWSQTNLRRLGDMTKKEGEVYPGIYVKREIVVKGKTR